MNRRHVATGGIVPTLLLTLAAASTHAQDATIAQRIALRLEDVRDELIELRRDIHKHPEVSGQEVRTAGLVAARLRSLGLDVQTEVGGHGVVGILSGGRAGPVVAYRADMDAVFSNATDPVPFASEVPGVRHICGHDIHTTVAVGIAEGLAAVRDELPGTVKFIFQPAEENIQGAKAMIEDGVLHDPSPEAIFAVHSAPLEVGQIGSVEGLSLPGLDQFTVTLRGENVQNSARAYARAISSVNTGQDVEPSSYVQAMLARSEQGDAGDEWVITGVIRAGSPEARARARERIQQQLRAVGQEGISFEFTHDGMTLPDMSNNSELVRSTLDAIRSAVGVDGLIEVNAVTPFFGEDFAYFQQHIPGAMYWLGVSNSELGYVGMPHSPDFVADEESIFVGARAMAAILLHYLESH